MSHIAFLRRFIQPLAAVLCAAVIFTQNGAAEDQPAKDPAPGNSKPAGACSSQTPASTPSSTPQAKREGTITNRGRKPLALPTTQPATPVGRYKKSLLDAIGARWHYYVTSRKDSLSLGSTRVEFRVNSQGEVENVKVVSNTSNQAFATLCTQAVEDTIPPALTAEVLADAKGKPVDMTITFTYFDAGNASSPTPSLTPVRR